jgi:hypothetical protein
MRKACDKQSVDDLKHVFHNARHRSAGRIDHRQLRMMNQNGPTIGEADFEWLKQHGTVESGSWLY